MSPDFLNPWGDAESTREISRVGLRLVTDRQDFHFVDSVYSERQYAYLNNKRKKPVWLTLDVRQAEALGCQFTKLNNDVIVTQCAQGFIDATAIDSVCAPDRMFLDRKSLILDPPVLAVTDAPPEAHKPEHTDGDHRASFSININSDNERSPRGPNASPPPPNQTARNRKSSAPNAAASKTKSAPLNPPMAPVQHPGGDGKKGESLFRAPILSPDRLGLAPQRQSGRFRDSLRKGQGSSTPRGSSRPFRSRSPHRSNPTDTE